MDKELEYLLQNKPSVIRNSTVILLVRILSWVLGSLLSLLGLGLLISGFVSGDLMKMIMPSEFVVNAEEAQDIWNGVSLAQGVLCLAVGLILLLAVKLAKMVLVRNKFIFDLFSWWVEYEERQKAWKFEQGQG